MTLQKKSTIIVAGILFFIIAINTTVLTYVASQKYRNAMLSKTTAVGESLQKEFAKVLDLGVPIESLEGVNEKLSELVSRDKAIGYAMLVSKEGKILFHNDASNAGKVMKDNASLKAAASQQTLIQTVDSYYDLSFPLLDAVGKIQGVVRIGVKLEAINSQVYVLLLWAVRISSLCFIWLSRLSMDLYQNLLQNR
jgi:sensor histidine kinase regulating citrate/malate metabolism